jgi:hypothetical protein
VGQGNCEDYSSKFLFVHFPAFGQIWSQSQVGMCMDWHASGFRWVATAAMDQYQQHNQQSWLTWQLSSFARLGKHATTPPTNLGFHSQLQVENIIEGRPSTNICPQRQITDRISFQELDVLLAALGCGCEGMPSPWRLWANKRTTAEPTWRAILQASDLKAAGFPSLFLYAPPFLRL